MDPQVIIDRLLRFARLDTAVFEEMRDDGNATIPAIVIAAASFLLAGFGGWLFWLVEGGSYVGSGYKGIVGTILATVMWVVWIAVAYLILVNVFHYAGNLERCIRACGLAAVPAALTLLMFLPGINFAIGLISIALVFLLMDIGIQVSIDAQPGHVILATFAGFAVFSAVLSLAVESTTWLAPGVYLFKILGTHT